MRNRTLGLALLFLPLVPSVALADGYNFQTVINPGDTAFTQTLGINNAGTVAGYFGDGSVVPNNGFTVIPPSYIVFTSENFPGAAQTQVIGINGSGDTDGFYIDSGGVTHGFMLIGGVYQTFDFPGQTFTQLLGINNGDVGAGYWQNSSVRSSRLLCQAAYLRTRRPASIEHQRPGNGC